MFSLPMRLARRKVTYAGAIIFSLTAALSSLNHACPGCGRQSCSNLQLTTTFPRPLGLAEVHAMLHFHSSTGSRLWNTASPYAHVFPGVARRLDRIYRNRMQVEPCIELAYATIAESCPPILVSQPRSARKLNSGIFSVAADGPSRPYPCAPIMRCACSFA